MSLLTDENQANKAKEELRIFAKVMINISLPSSGENSIPREIVKAPVVIRSPCEKSAA